MWQKRAVLATLMLAIAPVSFAQKAAAEDPVGVTATEIKVGATFPFSGPASALGNVGKALMGYVEFINDKGGVNGRKIKLIALDDAYSPSKSVEQTRKLVESEEVAFLFSPLGTASISANVKYANSKRCRTSSFFQAQTSSPIMPSILTPRPGFRATIPRVGCMRNS